MRSNAAEVSQYLAALTEERRHALAKVREVVLAHLPRGYEEAMNWGMISYQVPLDTYPETYNGQPLMYAALASQKRHMSLYLTAMYIDETIMNHFQASYRERGKRLEAGKSCIRFRVLEELPLDLVAETIALYSPDQFIQRMEQIRSKGSGKSG